MRRRAAAVSDEPLSFGAADIAKFLDDANRPNFAAFVRHLDARARSHNVELETMRRHACDLLDRLHKYEPPGVAHDRVDCTPPPEASD